jgi:hypothetical protein
MKIIGIIGTRRRDSTEAYKKVKAKFDEIYEDGDWICSGGCKQGGDRFADKISEKEGIPMLRFPPAYKKYGSPAALFIRNGHVAENSDEMIACVVSPEDGLDEVLKRKRGGTEDTLRKFMKRVNESSKVHLV